jgi:uncharacterized protein (TIGR02246 family)
MRTSSTTLVAMLAVSCFAANSTLAGDKEDIEAAVVKFEQAANAGDAAGVAAMYADDAALLPPGEPMVQGSDKVLVSWKSMLDTGMSDLDMTPTEVIVSGNNASEVGTFTYKAGDVSGAGKYIALWVKGDDGTWKIHRDIWNEDAPMQE